MSVLCPTPHIRTGPNPGHPPLPPTPRSNPRKEKETAKRNQPTPPPHQHGGWNGVRPKIQSSPLLSHFWGGCFVVRHRHRVWCMSRSSETPQPPNTTPQKKKVGNGYRGKCQVLGKPRKTEQTEKGGVGKTLRGGGGVNPPFSPKKGRNKNPPPKGWGGVPIKSQTRLNLKQEKRPRNCPRFFFFPSKETESKIHEHTCQSWFFLAVSTLAFNHYRVRDGGPW